VGLKCVPHRGCALRRRALVVGALRVQLEGDVFGPEQPILHQVVQADAQRVAGKG
jgi:hypothetical protein